MALFLGAKARKCARPRDNLGRTNNGFHIDDREIALMWVRGINAHCTSGCVKMIDKHHEVTIWGVSGNVISGSNFRVTGKETGANVKRWQEIEWQ
ncbi:hypothetical protein [Bradyrhizobium mercantei]|uniref:hypothetical protein n=1 Tax=Bradyrhizobium mercantei TaxID=1904807 RepID=UPI0011785705|nr:hypothetical protein [Bradyrhizobium mercantei]